jgi:hypothetical protein
MDKHLTKQEQFDFYADNSDVLRVVYEGMTEYVERYYKDEDWNPLTGKGSWKLALAGKELTITSDEIKKGTIHGDGDWQIDLSNGRIIHISFCVTVRVLEVQRKYTKNQLLD